MPSAATETKQTGALTLENERVAVERAANPLPVAVTEAPTAPVEMERRRFGWTVKLAKARFSPWLAVIVCAPAEAAGMTRAIEEKDPEAVVVAVPRSVDEGESVRRTVESEAKPVPLAESELPTMPLDAVRESVGVTANVAVATSATTPPS